MRAQLKLQKRHFELIAQCIKDSDLPKEHAEKVIKSFILKLYATNTAFDAAKFSRAAGVWYDE